MPTNNNLFIFKYMNHLPYIILIIAEYRINRNKVENVNTGT